MSKNNLFNQPGIEQLIPGSELPVAVKVTGRNLHAVSLIVSVRGETTKSRASVGAFFEDNGALDHVQIVDKTGSFEAKAGEYLLLSDDRATVVVADEGHYQFAKTILPVIDALDEGIAAFAQGVAKGFVSGIAGI